MRAPSGGASAVDTERLLFIDAPKLTEAADPVEVGGSLAIVGWALARSGVASIGIALDDVPVLAAQYGIARGDVAAAYPDWNGAAYSGFAASIPARVMAPGPHTVGVTVLDKGGASATVAFGIAVAESAEGAGPGLLRQKMTEAEVDLQRRILTGLDWDPLFCVVVVADAGAPGARIDATLASLRRQVYERWQVVIVTRADARGLSRRVRDGFDDIAGRVRIVTRPTGTPLGARAKKRDPVLITVLRAGDRLGCDALMEFAVASGLEREADFFYGDERRRGPGGPVAAFFKPDWSPDLLLATNYVGRCWCARAALVARAGVTLASLQGRGDYDAVLRCTEHARAIRRVGTVLHERAPGGDRPAQERKALGAALKRRGIDAKVAPGRLPGTHRVRRAVAADDVVSIIMPVRAASNALRTRLGSLRAITSYRAFEIICIGQAGDTEGLAAACDRVIAASGPFERWRLATLGARAARGRHLLFLDNAIEVIDPAWLEALLEHSQQGHMGAVGPMLLRPDRTIASAGIFLAGPAGMRHAGRSRPEQDPGYFGLTQVERNVIAVAGACLMTRRDTFAASGGFDARQAGANADLDYCLKLWQRGLSSVYTPHARLVCHGDDVPAAREDAGAVATRWRGVFLDGDPFFHPRLSQALGKVVPEREPVERVASGHPLFAKDAIKRILAVKLDHLGDCVTALPALRRLKRHFPAARLSVLSGPWAKDVWALEPSIDAVIDFEFYFARSGRGARAVSDKDLAALERRLAPSRFDLAVDLRKIPDTRPILQRTGARILAGFDHGGRFPWLDVALEWDADPPLVPKRQQIGDDFVNLVDAIAAAGEPDRQVIAPRVRPALTLPAGTARRLFARPVVCVHPAAGNALRQWPPTQFAALIDLLVERRSVNVALIGRQDEQAIAQAVVAGVERRDAVFALLGKITMPELPAFLSRCVLFVGNNSGPKHLAAGLGVPTVAIHSGVVDTVEWGPLGPNAIAVRRDMACAPCYLQTAQDCPRGLACLTGIGAGEVYRTCERMLAIKPATRRPRPPLKRRLTEAMYP